MSTPPRDDELARAIERLQTFASEVPHEAVETRRRVLASERAARRSRGRMALITAGLIALLGGPALAHFTGVIDLRPDWLSAAAGRDVPPTKPSREDRPRRSPPKQSALPVSPVFEPAPTVLPTPNVPSTKPVASTDKPKPRKPQAREPAVDTRELYRLAHGAHFGGGDPEHALRAWETFLAAAPSDAFAPEARYNRAILLVKLERHTQALDALTPIACAPSGAYRQREARALIDRVRARAPELRIPVCLEGP
jgi:hypothetical protein